jgi:hypothetical protein
MLHAQQTKQILEKEEWERKVRSDRILQRYNTYHNLETSGLPHGTANHTRTATNDCVSVL